MGGSLAGDRLCDLIIMSRSWWLFQEGRTYLDAGRKLLGLECERI